ncbi:MAG: YfiR/HmsC family protein [Bacteroidales bacterium]
MQFRSAVLSILVILFSGIQAISIDSYLNKQVSEAKVKAALIVNFAQNVQWPNEAKISTFKIGIIDKDSSVFKELNLVQNNQKIKGKPFYVYLANQDEDLSKYNILYFGEDAGKTLSNVYRDINHKDVLIITDRSADRVLTMINIIYNQDKKTFSFEINRENLNTNGFVVNSKILLLGGSYVDIKELYLQTSEQLRRETQRIIQYKEELERISKEKEEYQSEVNQLNDRISDLSLSIKQSEEEYLSLNNKLKTRDSLLLSRTVELQRKIDESRSLQGLIRSQLSSIKNATGKLDSLDVEINWKQEELRTKQIQIDKQNEEISQQDLIILRQQKRFLIVMLISLGLTLSLFFAFFAYRMKRNLNVKLERLVEERTFELEISREYFVSLFENSPMAMFELDYSALKIFVDNVKLLNRDDAVNDLEFIKEISEGIKLIKVINTNQAGIELFGFKSKDDAQLKYSNTYNDLSFDSFKTVFYAMVDRKSSCSYEAIRQTLDGTLLYVQNKWMVLPGYEDNYEKILLSTSDITALKSYQKELNRHKDHLEEIVLERTNEIIKLNQDLTIANAELQKKTEELSQIIQMLNDTQDQLIQSEKMASIGMLTAGIAHEINNPVNYISGSYQALQTQLDEFWDLLKDYRGSLASKGLKDGLAEIEAKHRINTEELYGSMTMLLSNIETGINRTTEIIRSLMAFTRNESHELCEFDLKKGIRDVLIILKSKYSDRIAITEEYDSNLPLIMCNSNGIGQVLMNLISNAIDAIPNQGEIRIAAKYKSLDDEVMISVHDSGDGIPAEIIDKIFDPFFTTKEVGKGTGLGLYISYNMIKAHHGTIDVNSTVGMGTSFTVTIPRKSKVNNS